MHLILTILQRIRIRNASLTSRSTGVLNTMIHDETEAVIAHEISHMSNREMVAMILIQGIVNTFVIVLSLLID